MGQSLNKVQISYSQAMNKLIEGRGNMIKQAESFHTLGVEIQKPISPVLVEKSKKKEERHSVSHEDELPCVVTE